MRVLLLVGLLGLALAGRGAAQRWEPEHVALATTSTALILADWATEADAIRRCAEPGIICLPSIEQNPLIGRSPSLGTLRAWCVFAISGNLVVGSLLKNRWARTAWFAGVTAIEYATVQHNTRAGFRVSLRL
jgi:hypothetical protein